MSAASLTHGPEVADIFMQLANQFGPKQIGAFMLSPRRKAWRRKNARRKRHAQGLK